MSTDTEISLVALRALTNSLLDHVEEVHGAHIALKHDYFWWTPAPEVYDVNVEPTSFTIGQLSECSENLQQLRADGHSVSYALVWLSSILRSIGEQVVP